MDSSSSSYLLNKKFGTTVVLPSSKTFISNTNCNTNNSNNKKIEEIKNNNNFTTTILKNNSSSPFSLKEELKQQTSSPTLTLASTALVNDVLKSELLNSHVVKIQVSQNNNLNKIVNNSNNNVNSFINNKNSSKISYISIGLPSTSTSSTVTPISPSSFNINNNSKTSLIKLENNKENINKNNSVVNIINNNNNINNYNNLKPNEEMVQKQNQSDLDVNQPYYYYMMTSGQCSPSDTLDSGTCSDLEVTPPPLVKKSMSPTSKYIKSNSNLNSNNHKNENKISLNGNISDSEESQLSLSCDSLNGSDIIGVVNNNNINNHNNNINVKNHVNIKKNNELLSPPIPPIPPPQPSLNSNNLQNATIVCLPDSLLKDIRDHSNKLNSFDIKDKIEIRSYLSRETINNSSPETIQIIPTSNVQTQNHKNSSYKKNDFYENDKFYNFHINENVCLDTLNTQKQSIKIEIDESFAGYKDINNGPSTIRSAKGTIRGVKNRVRNGIATFLQMQNTNIKNYKEKDAGKVVLYTTSMGILRETYAKCVNMKQILRTLLIKFEERDVFMSCEYQMEIKDRMQSDRINVPQLFVDGQHIGDADCVERLNESGELRRMLKPYKALDPQYTCQLCGGYRLLPCPSCNGSKKSVHRNHFTAEFIALKCMNCDEVGLVKCYNC